jgi:predicted dithiol-disulfide oxidoreductase (DUF899 family)
MTETRPIVSSKEWEAARKELLPKEDELIRARDALAAERRQMPWMEVQDEYRFEGPNGSVTLVDLFEGRPQLIVYRAFYGPDVTTYARGRSYPEYACVGCSFVADQLADAAHLHAKHTSLAFVSRAPQDAIQGLRKRHGWEHIPWYSLVDDFDKDFGVDEWHGHNVFLSEGDRIFRTYCVGGDVDQYLGGDLELSRVDRARPPGGDVIGHVAGYPSRRSPRRQVPVLRWWRAGRARAAPATLTKPGVRPERSGVGDPTRRAARR